ncbi:MAG: biotin--[acetyl-CoA-carboxylase] ligase [Desulfovibrionales bacterium]
MYWEPEGGDPGEHAPRFRVTDLIWETELRDQGPWNEVETVPGVPGRFWAAQEGDTGHTLVVCDACSSSLDAAWELGHKGLLPEWGSVLAISQTAGRGQLRRRWESPPGNVYAALMLPDPPPHGVHWPLVVGYLLAEGLEHLGVHVTLKWPNDLVLEGAKVGGVLVEERRGVCVAGIGLNVNSCPLPDRIRADAALQATCLDEFGHRFTPLHLWRHLVQSMESWYQDVVISLPSPEIIARIQNRLAFLGRRVRTSEFHGNAVEGIVVGLTPEGGIRLRTDGEEIALVSGSIYPFP